MDKVWIIYRECHNIYPGYKKVEGVVHTKEQAQSFAADLCERMDEKFGCSYQEWTMDSEKA